MISSLLKILLLVSFTDAAELIHSPGLIAQNYDKEWGPNFGVEYSAIVVNDSSINLFGYVASSYYNRSDYSTTINLGIEVLYSHKFSTTVNEHAIYIDPLKQDTQIFSLLLPDFELGASYNNRYGLGIHTSVFLNFYIVHLFVDNNFYKGKSDHIAGIKMKIPFGKPLKRILDPIAGI